MYLAQSINRYHSLKNNSQEIANRNDSPSTASRRFLVNRSAVSNYSAYLSSLIANHQKENPISKLQDPQAIHGKIFKMQQYSIKPVVLQEISQIDLSTFLEPPVDTKFVSKLDIQLCMESFNTRTVPKKLLQEIRYLPAERKIDRFELERRNRSSPPDVAQVNTFSGKSETSKIKSTDESDFYPFSNSSSEFSSENPKAKASSDESYTSKKLYSAFSYVKPSHTIHSYEESTSDRNNYKSSFSLALSKSTSSTSSSSFTSSGFSSANIKYPVPELSELIDEPNKFANGLPTDAQPLKQHQPVVNSKMSRQLLLPAANRHGSSRTQNELTLPPIVETQISNNPNVNNNSKKSNSSARVDSGIAIDYPNDNQQTGGWTLSPNESENGADNRNNESITTTFEIVEGNMKKNNTSSTLNSLGKSSSIQSKLTGTTNISTNSSKFSQSFNNTNPSNVTTKIVPISILQSEQNYIANSDRLATIDMFPDHLKHNQSSNDPTNNINNQRTNTSNLSNKKELNTSNSNLESVHKSSSNATKPYINFKATRVKDQNEKQNAMNTSINNNNNNNGIWAPGMQRQNTMTTIVHDNSMNGITRRNSNSTIANNTTASYQSARPVPKPRTVEISRRSLSLQRNNSSVPPQTNKNIPSHASLYNKTQNHFKSTQNHFNSSPNTNLNRFKSTQIATINSLKRDPSFRMNRQNTNVSLKAKDGSVTNSARPKTTIYGQPQTNKNNLKSINSTSNLNGKLVQSKKENIKPTQKNTKNPPNDTQRQTSNAEVGLVVEAIPEPIVAFELPESTESSIIDYTLERIRKWLEDMESCNLIRPPSQLAWRDVNKDGNTKTPNEFSKNFNNEYCLSDYDSFDDQIVEYNRVVDKTFHIIHDENDDFIPENVDNTENP